MSDAAGFAQAWTAATRAGRVLSLIYAMGFVLAFAYCCARWCATGASPPSAHFCLAFSGGMAMEMRIMRTELLPPHCLFPPCSCCSSPRNAAHRWWRPVVVGCASLLITLAMLNKIQFLFLVCALPILLLPFGPRERGARILE